MEGPAVEHYDFRTTSVLVVDNNRFMRTILRNALTSMNFGNIDEAHSGTQALDMIRGADYDLIITDLEMDGGDGLSLMSDMRNDSGVLNPLVPVIVISGNTTAESVMTARDHGATKFLAKPLSPDSLYSRIVATIEKPRNFVRTSDYFGPDRRRRNVRRLIGKGRRATH